MSDTDEKTDANGTDDTAEAGGDVATASASGAESSDDERLEQVGDQIDRARDSAQEILDEGGEQFVESGNKGPEEDDQTIAPPG